MSAAEISPATRASATVKGRFRSCGGSSLGCASRAAVTGAVERWRFAGNGRSEGSHSADEASAQGYLTSSVPCGSPLPEASPDSEP